MGGVLAPNFLGCLGAINYDIFMPFFTDALETESLNQTDSTSIGLPSIVLEIYTVKTHSRFIKRDTL